MTHKYVAELLREAAHQIDIDGTPAQAGPTADEMRDWANMLDPQCPTCQGGGEIAPNTDCPDCGGTGEITRRSP